jgi:riboflavin transporter FmnP
MGIRRIVVISLLSILHFLCDLICAFKVVGTLGFEYIEYSLIIFILYNGLAFCFQPLAGLVVDKVHKEKELLLSSGAFFINWCLF